jgi:hypothetical protein
MAFDSLSEVQTAVADKMLALAERRGNEQPDEATLLILRLLNRLDRAWEGWNPETSGQWTPQPRADGQTQWPLLSILPPHLRMPDKRQLRAYRATPGSLSAITAPSFYCHHDPLEYDEEESSEYDEEDSSEHAERESNDDDDEYPE